MRHLIEELEIVTEKGCKPIEEAENAKLDKMLEPLLQNVAIIKKKIKNSKDGNVKELYELLGMTEKLIATIKGGSSTDGSVKDDKDIEWGFDLTAFGSQKVLKSFLKKFKLKRQPRTDPEAKGYRDAIVWRSPKVMFITAQDPEKSDDAYGAYMGISGDAKQVKAIASWIRAELDPKGESKYDREYV